MAAIALIRLRGAAALGDLRILLAGDFFRDHVEVHHVVAWWGLVALSAAG